MADDSTTGDIIWRHLDPKTIELTNRPPQGPAVVGGGSGGPMAAEAQRLGMNDQEFRNYDAGMARRERDRPGLLGPMDEEQKPATKFQMRRQFRKLGKAMKAGDTRAAVAELMDSGGLYVDDNGDIYSSVQHKLDKGKVVDAVRDYHQWIKDSQDQFDSATSNQLSQLMQAAREGDQDAARTLLDRVH